MRRVVLWFLAAAIVLDVAYWTLWFAARSVVASEHSASYYAFENAFPLADAWLALACAGAFVTLRNERPTAGFWLVAAGGAGLYLFSMDLLYDLEHAVFVRGAGGAVESAIVAVTLVFSLTALAYARQVTNVVRTGASSPARADRS